MLGDLDIARQVLLLASQQLLQEHSDATAVAHNTWLSSIKHPVGQQNKPLRYPPIPAPPDEQLIMARAEVLLARLQDAKTKNTNGVT